MTPADTRVHVQVLASRGISSEQSTPRSVQEANCSHEVAMMLTWLQRQAASLGQEAQHLEGQLKSALAGHTRPPRPPEDVLAGSSPGCCMTSVLLTHVWCPQAAQVRST